MSLFEMLAQAANPTTTPQPVPSLLQTIQSIFPILLIIIVFYFLVFGSKRKQEKQRQTMLSQLKKGDRIQTIGGILGTVVEARETEVVVKVDENSNTKIKFSRSAIHRVFNEEDKAESK